MVATRNMANNAIQQRQVIVERLTNYPQGSSIDLALTQAGVMSITDLTAQAYEDFMDMRYDVPAAVGEGEEAPPIPVMEEHTLTRFESGILKCLKAYAQYTRGQGTDITHEWWENTTRETFDDFRITQECTMMISGG